MIGGPTRFPSLNRDISRFLVSAAAKKLANFTGRGDAIFSQQP
jgi:hypothetical protein